MSETMRIKLLELFNHKLVIKNCDEALLGKTVFALEFGYCEGFPGWDSLYSEWEKINAIGDSISANILRLAVQNVLAYIEFLKTGNDLFSVEYFTHQLQSYIRELDSRKCGYLDPSSADFVGELQAWLNRIQPNQDLFVQDVLTVFVKNNLSLATTLVDKQESTVAMDLIRNLNNHLTGCKGISDVSYYALIRVEYFALLTNFLSNYGFELIAPISGSYFDKASQSMVIPVADDGGLRVLYTTRFGLKKGLEVLLRAEVEVRQTVVTETVTQTVVPETLPTNMGGTSVSTVVSQAPQTVSERSPNRSPNGGQI